MNNNKSLFWYGIRARLMKIIGGIMIFVGIFFLFSNIFLGIIIGVLGIILLAMGSRNEYDYKRQGGYIVYKDWKEE